MSEPIRIQPDLEFVKELQSTGGQDLKKCYQCATCSVVCPLSPMDRAFPRKEMVWAQWGLKDRLVNDIDMWLCHKCGQCTDQCPRGAKPGELMASLRNMAYKNLAGPKFMGEWMSSLKHLPKLIAIPAVIYLIFWFITGSIHDTPFPLEHGHVDFALIFPPLATIDTVFVLASLFVVFTFYQGIRNLWQSFESQPSTFVIGYQKPDNFLISLWEVIRQEVVTHKKWQDCGQEEETHQVRFKGHLILFYSFVALFIVTSIVAFTYWAGKVTPYLDMAYPMPLWNPVKILANLGAIALVVGLVYLTRRRLNDTGSDASSYHDWYLLGVIWGVALTGILAQIFRIAEVAGLAYFVYYLHLISVFMLIAYAPWSKLGHMVYRVAALTYARRHGRLATELETSKNKLFVV